MQAALIGAGLFGLMGMTGLFPVLGALVCRPKGTSERGAANRFSRIEILIPAHDEEGTLSETLKRIQLAVLNLQRVRHDVQVRIIVGADSCSDRTAEIARAEGADVIEYPDHRSKWKTLKALVKQAQSNTDWIVLADAGAIWPDDLLVSLASRMDEPDIAAVAPSYHPHDAGRLELSHWQVERWLKTLENRAGGPVSVHGATVFYRARPLASALLKLEGNDWLNDDVVIPLTIRTLFPDSRILYWPGKRKGERISDLGLQKSAGEYRRRRRLNVGNIEWIGTLLPSAMTSGSLAGLIALRRVFRVFWAYWFLFIVLGLIETGWQFLGLMFLSSLSLVFARNLFDAAVASLATPVYLLTGTRRIVWR